MVAADTLDNVLAMLRTMMRSRKFVVTAVIGLALGGHLLWTKSYG